ncbi:hypothetical protein [Salininema proteolyticum]|uniref:DUF998 domain-containing protein n=1 Tax=Salininema proteolyticum TaxID=1607685 RepID=A0ABV8TTE5_9ACTN
MAETAGTTGSRPEGEDGAPSASAEAAGPRSEPGGDAVARKAAAAVLLLAAFLIVAAASLDWLYSGGTDPRDTVLSRAAQMGFSDNSSEWLFTALPVAAPAAAVWLAPSRATRWAASLCYALYLVAGASLAASAALFGFDSALQVEQADYEWITPGDAGWTLVVQSAHLLVAGALWAWAARRSRISS